MKRFSLVLVAGVAAAVALANLQGVNIAWKPKEGDTSKYRLTTKASIQGTEMNFAATLTMKVKEVKEDKITVEETQSEISVKFGDQDFSSMMPASIAQTTIMKADGTVIERKSEMEEAGSERMSAALEYRYPTKPIEKGGTWGFKAEADSAKKLPAREATYTYVGDEEVGKFKTFKITYSYKETEGSAPMTVTGTLWMSQANGDVIKGVYEMKNVEFQEGMGASDATAEIVRVD